MKTLDQILAEEGVKVGGRGWLRSTANGRHQTICPKCSHQRKPSNRRKPCMTVTIDERGVWFGCNHCPHFVARFF